MTDKHNTLWVGAAVLFGVGVLVHQMGGPAAEYLLGAALVLLAVDCTTWLRHRAGGRT